MSTTQRELLEEGIQTFREVFDANKVSVTRDQMRKLLNLEIVVNQMVEALRSVEGKSRDDILKLMDQPEHDEASQAGA